MVVTLFPSSRATSPAVRGTSEGVEAEAEESCDVVIVDLIRFNFLHPALPRRGRRGWLGGFERATRVLARTRFAHGPNTVT